MSAEICPAATSGPPQQEAVELPGVEISDAPQQDGAGLIPPTIVQPFAIFP